ncbi:hypothetical protein ABZ070_23780 [Streptomyces sp. NPDC006283]|uniref:hypothetical protein n=1 Tax=Streptomyces sp. NPDC006283 TaxID=3156741 RepID=UPI0033A5F9BF
MPHGHAALRKRCEAILSQLELRNPFSLEELCSRIAEQRGRPLRLHPLPEEAARSGVCGLWVGTESVDHVFYEARTSRPHQEHIVLHELGHILFGHNFLAGAESGGGYPTALGRTDYTTREEQEAEMLASLIRTKAGALPLGREPDGTLERLGSALGVRSSDAG